MLDQKITDRARNLIHPAINARRHPLQMKVGEILGKMAARGVAMSSMTVELVFRECEREVIARNRLAWENLRKVHELLVGIRTPTLAEDFKKEVAIYRQESVHELTQTVQDIVARTGVINPSQQPSLSHSQIQAQQEVDAEIDLYVDTLARRPVRVASDTRSGPPLVFVSCGQTTDEEINLGTAIVTLIDKHLAPCVGYFAQKQNSLDGLSQHIFGSLNKCVGFIAVMHHRGIVKTRSKEQIRASVWIEQEIAIAAFLTQVQNRDIRVVTYIQKDIAREGVRDKLLLNAQPFEANDEVLAHLEKSILNGDFEPRAGTR